MKSRCTLVPRRILPHRVTRRLIVASSASLLNGSHMLHEVVSDAADDAQRPFAPKAKAVYAWKRSAAAEVAPHGLSTGHQVTGASAALGSRSPVSIAAYRCTCVVRARATVQLTKTMSQTGPSVSNEPTD